VRGGLRGALALISAAAGLALFPAAPAVAGEDLEAELFDVQIVCEVRCEAIGVQIRVRNGTSEPICLPSNDLKFLPGQLRLMTPEGLADSYNGGSGPPPPKQIDATSFDFPVYLIGAGKELVVRSSGSGFFDIARGQVTEVMLSFRSFVCGERASTRGPIRSHTATAPVRYEDSMDAPGVSIPELR